MQKCATAEIILFSPSPSPFSGGHESERERERSGRCAQQTDLFRTAFRLGEQLP